MPDPALVDTFRSARQAYERARQALVPLLERMALESVADVLPGADTLELYGEYNEDSIPVLRIQRVIDTSGSKLFDATEGHDEPNVEDTIDMVDTEYLYLLIDLTGDEYLGNKTIDRGGQ